MPDLLELLKQRARSLVISLMLVWTSAGVVLWLLPVLYKAETTSVPSSAYAADPNRLFNQQIQQLYSPIGSSDELDLLVGSARLDTIYRPLVRQFKLFVHYAVSDSGEFYGEKGFWKAVRKLKKNVRVYKSDYGELKVQVWDTDPVLAAALANALTARLDSLHRDLMSRQNQQTRDALQKALTRLSTSDSLSSEETARQQSLYRNLIEQYTLLLEQRPSSIQVVDPAVTPVFPDKPDWFLNLFAVTILTIIIWLISSLWSTRRTYYEVDPGR